MKHGFIKVAAATPRVTVADCKANGEEILKAIHEMEKEHVKLMVFPEFCITGYTCHDLFLQRCLLDSAWDELLHIADETKETDALIFVGLPLRHRGKLYNVAAALNHGRIVGFVPKTHIPNYNEFYEQRQFAGAEEEDVEFVDFLKGVKKIGRASCRERFLPENSGKRAVCTADLRIYLCKRRRGRVHPGSCVWRTEYDRGKWLHACGKQTF